MKVLLVHNRYREPGGEEHAISQLEGLLARSHSVSRFEKRSEDWFGATGWQKAKQAIQVPFSRTVYQELRQCFERVKPDVVHVHNIFPFQTPSVYYAAASKRIPIVQTLHNFRHFCLNGLLLRDAKPCELCLGGNLMHGIVHRCYQGDRVKSGLMASTLFSHRILGTWNKVDRFIVLSQFSQRLFEKAGLSSKKCVLLRNAVSVPPAFNPGPQNLKTAPLIYIGRLSAEKGIKILLEAYKQISTFHPAVPLDVIGDGPLKIEVESFRKNNPSLLLRVHGPLYGEDKDRLLRKAGYLVFPSECYENCPYSVLEAFGYGVPVIASSLGGLPELVQEGRLGYLFKPGSAEDLVQQLRKAYSDEPYWRDMRKQVYDEACQNFEEKKWIQKVEDLYANVTSTG